MRRPRKRYVIGTLLALFLAITTLGVYANSQITVNSGNGVNLGAGNAPVSPCDTDVNITPIILNDGNNVWIQGFQYDNVDKPACVGYDFETRFASGANTSMPLFATSSISSDPYVLRVYAPTSSGNWSLGLGAQPTAEATVTQISASSFKVIFTTPVSAVSDFGKIAMAEIGHLPVGTFANGYSQVSGVTGYWENSCLVANNSKFYMLDVTNGLYMSSIIPQFPRPVGTVGLTQISDSAISGSNWYGLGCSSNGQYIAISGTNNKVVYSTDFGSTWQVKNTSSWLGTGTVGNISISNDGKVVALNTITSPGYFNFWVNGNFWTSTTSNADASYQISGAQSHTIKVCGNGTTVYGGGGTNSAGLYRWQTSAFSSGGNKASVAPANTNGTFGSYLLQIGCSADGQSAVIASYSNNAVYITRDQFATYYQPSGLSTNGSPLTASMSGDGKFIVVGTGGGTSTVGDAQYSTDYGYHLLNSSYTGHFMQTMTVSDDGSRLVTGGAGASYQAVVVLGSN